MAPWLAAGVRFAGHRFETPDDTNSWTIETPETEIVGNSKHLQIPIVAIPTRSLAEGCWPGDGAMRVVPMGVAVMRSSPATGEMIAGVVPPRALRLIQEWCELHRDELRLNWARARENAPLVRIDPLP